MNKLTDNPPRDQSFIFNNQNTTADSSHFYANQPSRQLELSQDLNGLNEGEALILEQDSKNGKPFESID